MSVVDTATGSRSDAIVQYERFLAACRPDAVQPLLLSALGGRTGEQVEVLDAKYESGKRAALLYRLGSRLVRGTIAPDASDADGVLIGDGFRATEYPVDPALPALSVVLDGATLEKALTDSTGGVVRDLRPELVRYRPGRRATFLISATRENGDGTTQVRYVAKAYHDAAKADAAALEARALTAHPPSDGLVLAPIAVHLSSQAVVVQEHVDGNPLQRVLAPDAIGTPTSHAAVARAARAVAALHERPARAERRRPIGRELERFGTRATGIALVAPDVGERFHELARRLRTMYADLGEGPVSLVHGDCKPSQFLLQDERVAILDLDHCGLGEPVYDVANFMSSLRQAAVRAGVDGAGSVSLAGSRELGATFADAYARARDIRGSAASEHSARLCFYGGVALTRKALRAFARAPLSALPEALITEAHRGLDEMRKCPS